MGSCAHDNDPSGSIKLEDFLTAYMNDRQFLNRVSAQWS
jgi:hypothetical protein